MSKRSQKQIDKAEQVIDQDGQYLQSDTLEGAVVAVMRAAVTVSIDPDDEVSISSHRGLSFCL